ncbi:glycosyltransferase family 4 protein [Leptospira borgpetersenii]|uniref:glycosyltransferase family 4 protein n=1 Tax=Leptospira borgpetersenii TaxID=174 RepID=UPI0002BD9786|nr:glycosyltransferase family 4 protein [Leptospira borgpetersenii]EMN12994.1 glycosyltransferase, group 1 family protein [Leptospira borgpetersenii str. Brem 307]
MKVLYIAPLPPPINGHSLVSKEFYDSIVSEHNVEVINLRKQSLKEGVDSIQRVVEILKVLVRTFFKKSKTDAVYFTISESFAGNLKDVLIYMICFNLLSKMYIHLHGGSLKRLLFDRYPWVFRLNRFFIKRVGGVILSGDSHLEIFRDYVDRKKISIIPNFAQDYLFLSEKAIRRKFEQPNPIRLLFISNMTPLKGYLILLEGFLSLKSDLQKKYVLEFAGRFDTEEEKSIFEERIEGKKNIRYHGLIDNEKKKELFEKTHIFCLPTMFFEGQPISILEAYAAGCVVITTGQSGILDIFTDQINGFRIQENSSESITKILSDLPVKQKSLLKIALYNNQSAVEKYRVGIYTSNLKDVIGL